MNKLLPKAFRRDIDRLLQLSRNCNCWISFIDTKEEAAIDLAEWVEMYNQAVSLSPNIINS